MDQDRNMALRDKNSFCDQSQFISNTQSHGYNQSYENNYSFQSFQQQQQQIQGLETADYQSYYNSNKKHSQINDYYINKNNEELKDITYISEEFSYSSVSKNQRCSFTQLVKDRDHNHIEIVNTIGNKTFQIQEINQVEELFYLNQRKPILQNDSYRSNSEIEISLNLNESNQSSDQNLGLVKFQEEKGDEGLEKNKILTNSLFYDSLQKEFLDYYNLDDEKKLIHLIVDELEEQIEEKCKNSPQNSKIRTADLFKQSFDEQFLRLKQCLYLIMNSDINKQFVNYSKQINQNICNQENQRILFVSNLTLKQHQSNKISYSEQERFQDQQRCFTEDQLLNSSSQSQDGSYFMHLHSFFSLKPKSISFLKNFDFSEIRQNQPKKHKKIRQKKENSSYIKNSQFHNLNKLFMYNILSMFRIDSLNNLNLPQVVIQELLGLIQKLKISSRRQHQKAKQGFYDYFTHSHYNVLFLKINENNIHSIRNSQLDLHLHQQCFNIDLSKNVPEIEIAFLNLIKEINYQIFMANIREKEQIDDGSQTKQNIRTKYTIKAIDGIKKIAKGNLIKKF